MLAAGWNTPIYWLAADHSAGEPQLVVAFALRGSVDATDPPALERASSQVPSILARPSLKVVCSLDITIDDTEIAGSPYTHRRFHVLSSTRTVP